jgi:hypothetical protein
MTPVQGASSPNMLPANAMLGKNLTPGAMPSGPSLGTSGAKGTPPVATKNIMNKYNETAKGMVQNMRP